MNTLAKSMALAPFNLLYKVSPAACLKVLFRLKQGYRLDLDNPRTFSEKIQWIKLNDRNPLMPRCADKFEVRGYVEECGCGCYLNELLWHGSDPEQIPFDELPERYVIKATHGSTFNVINDGTRPINRNRVVSQLRKWLATDFLPCYGEWFYGRRGGIEPSIVVERYLEGDPQRGLDDYKVFVMNGKARLVLVCTGRTNGSHCEDIYDLDWNHIVDVDMGESKSGLEIPRPECLDEMISVAETLASPFACARVDFFLGESLIFGEITFTSGSGFDRFHPRAFDLELGDMLRLPYEDSAASRGATLGDEHYHQERPACVVQSVIQSEPQAHATDPAPDEAGI